MTRREMRCDGCGRFVSTLNSVWASPPQNGIDREVCDSCLWTDSTDEKEKS